MGVASFDSAQMSFVAESESRGKHEGISPFVHVRCLGRPRTSRRSQCQITRSNDSRRIVQPDVRWAEFLCLHENSFVCMRYCLSIESLAAVLFRPDLIELVGRFYPSALRESMRKEDLCLNTFHGQQDTLLRRIVDHNETRFSQKCVSRGNEISLA